jgi:Rad3-related DNA helicase
MRLEKMSISVENFKEEAPSFLFFHIANDRNALIDAPPGLGKTRSAAKAAIDLLNKKNKRIAIIEPTKTLRTQVSDYLTEEDKTIKFHVSKAWNDYICPLIKMSADPTLCSDRKGQCREEKRNCGVLKDIDLIKESKLTVATFAKLLLSKGLFQNYDTIIIDESHGFENAETTYLQTYLMFTQLEEVAEEVRPELPALAEKLANLANGLTRINEMLGDSLPLTAREVDWIREAFGDTMLRNAWLECTRDKKYPRYRKLYTNISSIHYRMQNITNNVFFFYEGSLFGRPKNMEVEVAGFFRNKNVGLLSATIDDKIKHARACGLDMRRFDESCGVILKDYPEKRRRNRKLIALTDGPVLSRSDGEEYETVRQQANEILLQFLEKFVIRTLVLFRGYNDQKLASEHFSQTKVASRIHHIWQGEDPDSIDEKIMKLKESDIVLTSASTRLWEGVDIPGLHLVIIDALPYPGKDPFEREYNFKAGHETMIKKLKQGLGRIVRSDDDWGAAVVIDNRFNQRFPRIAPRLPWYMDADFERLHLEKAINELDKFVKKHNGS